MNRCLLPMLGPLVGVTVAITSGCSSSAGSGYKAGELGNGGFYFSCDAAVSCARYSNDAAKFPKTVSMGATFQVRFVPNTSSDQTITFNERAPDRGITISAVGDDYVSRGPNGLLAHKTGYATLMSRDANGSLVDFVNIEIAKPDALVVYSAEETGDNPTRVDAVSLRAAERKTFRAFAEKNKSVLAGTLPIEWTSSNPKVANIENTSDGKATLIGVAPGTATLRAVGGTFPQDIPVEVK